MSNISQPSPVYSISVRQLVEFVLRRGDLTSGEGTPLRLRALRGMLAHQKLQRSRPAEYETEFAVSFDVPCPEFVLRISGRIDGIWKRPEGVLLEEIKTVTHSWDHEPNAVHWAQLKFYGFIICKQQQLPEIELQLTYFELWSEQITAFREKHSASNLTLFFQEVVAEYEAWILSQEHWRKVRDASCQKLSFPYGVFRKGQRTLSAAIYRTVLNSGTLFAEAPTGIGKTMSVLFPVVKAITARGVDKLFYVTAKTVTQTVAEKAFEHLKAAGLRLRTITITAKNKVCSRDGKPCDLADCPFAEGYYDRLKPALISALRSETLTRSILEGIASEYRLCPYEFSLDVSEWVDAVICDYNHAFDPRASLKRHFSESADTKLLLIDEAHNLLERAREMFSAELWLEDIDSTKDRLRGPFPKCANALRNFKKHAELLVSCSPLPIVRDEIPEKLLKYLELFTAAAEQYFGEQQNVDELLLETYYAIGAFLQIADYFDVHHRFLVDAPFGRTRVRLFCLDPSLLLRDVLAKVEAAVFFSATLTPLDYFRSALGGTDEDLTLKLNSPFASENLKLLVAPYIQTSFRHRAGSLDQVVKAIETFVAARRGNYIVYFPSYKYLNEVWAKLQGTLDDAELLVQTQAMTDSERHDFLHAFNAERNTTLVGLAVMGGVFGEGIDLLGERLIGVVVVGVGLPQICLERDLIRQHFEAKGLDGFAYAYVFPGFNRVLQAVGRVIRSESDRGVVLLIDSRFTEERFTGLFPVWWNVKRCSNVIMLANELDRFWQSSNATAVAVLDGEIT